MITPSSFDNINLVCIFDIFVVTLDILSDTNANNIELDTNTYLDIILAFVGVDKKFDDVLFMFLYKNESKLVPLDNIISHRFIFCDRYC